MDEIIASSCAARSEPASSEVAKKGCTPLSGKQALVNGCTRYQGCALAGDSGFAVVSTVTDNDTMDGGLSGDQCTAECQRHPTCTVGVFYARYRANLLMPGASAKNFPVGYCELWSDAGGAIEEKVNVNFPEFDMYYCRRSESAALAKMTTLPPTIPAATTLPPTDRPATNGATTAGATAAGTGGATNSNGAATAGTAGTTGTTAAGAGGNGAGAGPATNGATTAGATAAGTGGATNSNGAATAGTAGTTAAGAGGSSGGPAAAAGSVCIGTQTSLDKSCRCGADCYICEWPAAALACIKCENSKFLHKGECVVPLECPGFTNPFDAVGRGGRCDAVANVPVAAASSAVAEDIAGNAGGVSATPAQLNSIPGVSGALGGVDYSQTAVKAVNSNTANATDTANAADNVVAPTPPSSPTSDGSDDNTALVAALIALALLLCAATLAIATLLHQQSQKRAQAEGGQCLMT